MNVFLLDKPDIDSLWDFSDPEKSEENFCDILLQFQEGDPEFLELLTQIARAQGLQHKFDKAHHTLDQVERRSGKVATRVNIRYFLERGRVFEASGLPIQARSYFEQALEMANRLGEDSHAIDALQNLATLSQPDFAIDFNLRAIKTAESSPQVDSRSWLGSLYNSLGQTYYNAAEYPLALESFRKAERIHRAQGCERDRRTAQWGAGRTLRSMGHYEDALEIQRGLKEELEAWHEVDGYVFEEIAECLLALKRQKQARSYFTKAYETLSRYPQFADKELGRLERLKILGEE